MPNDRWMYLLGALGGGAILGLTNVFAPIHELYHAMVAASHGVEANITSWNTTQLSRFDWAANFSGWSANLWLGVIAGILGALVGRNSRAIGFTGGIGWSYAFVSWIRAFSSTDFNDAVLAHINAAPITMTEKQIAWQGIHQAINARWTTIGLFLLTIGGVVVLWNILRDKRQFPKKESPG